jgi:hypothetical protein
MGEFPLSFLSVREGGQWNDEQILLEGWARSSIAWRI